MAGPTWRWVPRHHWVRPFVSLTGDTDRGHGWMYRGIVRRDAWRIGKIGFGLLRMPKQSNEKLREE